MSHIEALREAVRVAGGQKAFGTLIGKAQQTVNYYITSGKGLPAEEVLKVEAETGVPRWRIRPDIYPFTLGASPGAGAVLSAQA